MIVCKECGYQNEDGALFCGGCPAYLPHHGEPVPEREPESPPQPEPIAEGAGAGEAPAAGLVGRLRGLVTREGQTAADGKGAVGDGARQDLPAGPEKTERVHEAGLDVPELEPPHEPEHVDADDERAKRASALVAPTPSDAAITPRRPQQPPERVSTESTTPSGEAGPGERPPERAPTPPPPRPPQRRAPTRPVQHGDLICGRCGEPNVATRHFCRRCAAPLADAVVAKLPWWRRLLQRRRRAVAAGERPGRPGGGAAARVRGARKAGRSVARLARAVLAIAVLLSAIGLIGPWRAPAQQRLQALYDSLRERFVPTLEPVAPVDIRATSALPDHPPLHATDGLSNTYWAEAAPGNGEGQVLVLTFAQPVHLARIGLLAGAAEEAFRKQPRPRSVHIVFSNGTSDDLELLDTAEFQTFEVDAPGVTEIELHFRSVHPSLEGDALSVTEVEFRARR